MKMWDFTWRVLQSRWLVLAAGLWIESVAGAAYTFGVYSQSLKLALGYDQERLDNLAFFKAIGGNVGVLSGLLYEVTPPWFVVLTGAAESALGYSMLYLTVTRRIAPPPFYQMCLFICLASNSNTFFSTACVVTNVRIFPRKRGVVIGLLKGFLGLSGAVLTQVFFAVSPGDPGAFLLLLSCLPVAVALLLMALIRVLPAKEEDNATFRDFSTLAVCLAAYLGLVIVLENIWGDLRWLMWSLCLLLLGFFLSLFAVVIKAEMSENQNQEVITEPLLSNSSSSGDHDAETGPNDNNHDDRKTGDFPRRGEEHSLREAVLALDFWLLVTAMFCSMGSGTTAIDNMGQIGASLGYKQVDINTFISLISIWNFVGRFGAGLASEFLLHQRGLARPFCLVVSLGLMCIGHLVMASAATGSLYIGSIIMGVCYGAQWTLMPATTSELFGLRRFGTLYNTIASASPVAAYVLSVRVAGYFYDREAKRQHGFTGDEPLLCHGPSCFRITFVILAVVCAFGCGVCVWLFWRTKRFYAQVHERLHKVE